ncbi:MAG TPA: hypothetical protein VM098_06405, partial [Phycisphaerae bacterium]|nr:hypothetical protein [Phycisphaerae bacterium]
MQTRTVFPDYAMIFLFFTTVFLFVPGCFIQGDYTVALPNGYILARSNSRDIAIFGPKELYHTQVVPPLIVSLG